MPGLWVRVVREAGVRVFIQKGAGFRNGKLSNREISFSHSARLFLDVTRSPAPTVISCVTSIIVLDADEPEPCYSVQSMDSIRKIPWNGLNVVSTFAGCGGSSTGYRMAGFRVLYANERDQHAVDSYGANCSPSTFVDGKDIRDVTGENILSVTGLDVGQLDVLDGSPPCQFFSMVGKRDSGWKESQEYRAAGGTEEKHVLNLFPEYIRLVRELRPKVFIAENVTGLVSGMAKGYFKRALAEMKDCGYRVEARIVAAQWLGIPQDRRRVIFVGARNDLDKDPVFPKPFSKVITVPEAFAGKNVERTDGFIPRRMTMGELKLLCSFPPDFALDGPYQKQWSRLGLSVPPLMMREIAGAVARGVFGCQPTSR